jgi:hypothetical protein
MAEQPYESPRKKLEKSRQERHLAFEALMVMVDNGELTLDEALAGLQVNMDTQKV